MKTLFLVAGATLALAACNDSPPVDNAPVPHEAVCDNAVGDNCVTADADLPPEDQNVIENKE
jgi:hypothetical protein